MWFPHLDLSVLWKRSSIFILPEIYTFVFPPFSTSYSRPCVAALACCSNVLAALADRHRWLSVYLLTYGLREQCRHFTQCWQIRRGLCPRTAALKANWCLQASTWGIVLISTLIIVLASALAFSSHPQESSDSSRLQEFNERTQVKKDCYDAGSETGLCLSVTGWMKL